MKQTIDEVKERIVSKEIWCCDSALMEMLLTVNSIVSHGDFNESFNWYEDIENLYYTDDEIIALYGEVDDEHREEVIQNCRDDGTDMKEIYEWWRISDWLAAKLRQYNEPILENDYGTWWGRTCTGQAIVLDEVMTAIARDVLDKC